MAIGERMGRRKFLKLSGAGLAIASAADLLACAAVQPPGASEGIAYFARFGVTERAARARPWRRPCRGAATSPTSSSSTGSAPTWRWRTAR